MWLLFWVYLAVVNILGFALMGIDKSKAKKQQWRISEANLLLSAAIGGSIGSYVGMQTFRHKTKHIKFTLGVPAIMIIQAVLTIFVLMS